MIFLNLDQTHNNKFKKIKLDLLKIVLKYCLNIKSSSELKLNFLKKILKKKSNNLKKKYILKKIYNVGIDKKFMLKELLNG